MRFAFLHKAMQIPRLMRTVKIADTDMDNAGAQARTVIVRAINAQLIQRGVFQGN
jgi:Mg/Co/Ni transporter MgtE